MQRDAAMALAQTVLIDLAGETETMSRFLALSGIDPRSLRQRAHEASFLAGLIGFVMEDEALLLAICERQRLPAADIGRARDALAGRPPDDA